jgi:hypothetical protein
MVTYAKIPYKDKVGNEGTKYTKDGKITKAATVPPEVLEKLQYAEKVGFDDEPDRRRCLFCDAPQKRVRALNMMMYDLCEWHYQHMNLGKIAQKAREVESQAVVVPVVPKKKKAKRTRKTALSNMLK